MQNRGISSELITPSCQNTWNADELQDKVSECSLIPTSTRPMEGPCEVKTSFQNSVAHCCYGKNEETASVPFTGGRGPKLSLVHDEDSLLTKRQKVSSPKEGSSISLKATESAIVDWLKNFDGVS